MMSSAETGEELMLNKPTPTKTTTSATTLTATSTTTMMTMNRSQPIHFINANKKMANDSNNSRASMSNDHYHHIHHIYAPPPLHATNSLLDHFYSSTGSFTGHHHVVGASYLSTSAGKIASNTPLNQAKSTGLYLNELINEFSNNRVSAFLPPDEIKTNDQVGAKNEIVSRIFAEVQEVQEGKVDNLLRVMSFHPEFLQEFINLYNYLMYSQHGALPYDWRHYIAIMAAARHKCIYLVKQQEREFLNQNGQPAWLNHGIAHIPHKLKGLYELNKLLCHQPWLINHTHLEKILKGQFSWTVTELTMAITILTLFHSLSGFAFGCGINENYTQELSRQYEREEEEKARRKQRAAASAKRRAAKKLAKRQEQLKQKQANNNANSRRTVLKNGGGGSSVIGRIDGVDEEELSDSEDQQAPDEDDNNEDSNENVNGDEEVEEDDGDEEDDEDDDEDQEDEDEEEDEYDEDDDRRLNDDGDDDDDDENLETGVDGFLPQQSQPSARHFGRSSRVHLRPAASNNTHHNDDGNVNGSSAGRGRSNSTGASNRTLSNSSASSCELGIDMLLKEMQMIKAEDKQNHHQQQNQQQQQQQQQTKTSTTSGVSTSDSLSSSMLSSCSGTTATTPSSSSSSASSSSLIMIQKQLARSNSPNMAHQCLSPTSISNLTAAASSSGPSTITNNSPTTTVASASASNTANNTTTTQKSSYSNYLNDLSNTTANRQHYQTAHDNNNNSIHHYNYHHYNQQHTNTYHNHHAASNHNPNNANISKDMNEIMRNEVEKSINTSSSLTRGKHVVKFMESSSSNKEDHHHPYHHAYNHHNNNNNNHTAPQQQHQQQQQQQQHEPVSAHSAIVAQKIRDYMLKYAFDLDYGYQDVETSADPSLRLEYYTWENQGYITAQSVYPDICDFLDKNFQVAANMTYNTMGNVKGVDTSLFRKAVWFYTHSLFGLRHDDYDYNQIRALLKSPLRKYIKMVCTQPERITKSHYDSIMKEFAHSEKVHMNLVIMEARIQASMLYFLRAVNSYFG